MNEALNALSLDTVCGSLAYTMGIEPPTHAAAPAPALKEYADKAFGGKKADRIFMYNPDAIAQWVYEKYPALLERVTALTELPLALCSVMPSVTPVCFGTMYTGAQPEVHGIRRYEKPVITLDCLFDALLRAGKRAAIVSQSNCSMSMIYLGRQMDYFVYDTIEEINAKAAELILADEYDFIAVYNGNYDATMHRCGPESVESLSQLRANADAFALFSTLIRTHWQHHNTLVGFAMDHGCHEIDENLGSHGLDMPEDLNILHRYMAYPAAE